MYAAAAAAAKSLQSCPTLCEPIDGSPPGSPVPGILQARTLEGTNRRRTEGEESISELEDRMAKITAEEQNKGKRMKRIDCSLRDLWDNIKCTNI